MNRWLPKVIVGLSFLIFPCVAQATQIGAQDDGAVMAGGQQLATAIQRAKEVHATTWRVIVRGRRGIAAYQDGMAQVCAAGFRVQITLTDYDQEQFVNDAILKWRQCVGIWSFWNEPELNIGFAWYEHVHRAGFALARALDPGSKVLIGECSSWASPANLRAEDTLPGDGLAIHPYQFKLRPETIPAANSGMSSGIGSLPKLSHKIKHRIYVTEFGYHANHEAWLGRALKVALRARAREFVLYQLTPELDTPRHWDTLLTATGVSALNSER